MPYYKKPSWFNVASENEVTPYDTFLNRRSFIKKSSLSLLGTYGVVSTLGLSHSLSAKKNPKNRSNRGLSLPVTRESIASSYNNFYEFGVKKPLVKIRSQKLTTRPWELEISGLCKYPKKVDLYQYIKKFSMEERIYRFRCVERWAMVVPWMGVSLSKIIRDAQPLSKARHLRFVTAFKPKEMPGIKELHYYSWPYYEGLRMDEAMHDLCFFTTGMYGKKLPNQNGAPVRIVVPWKYGYKSIKSVVKIEFVEQQPATFWNDANPDEYGFLSNVNPKVPHPRWSQKWEEDIGTREKRRTLLHNGYAREVASLYKS